MSETRRRGSRKPKEPECICGGRGLRCPVHVINQTGKLPTMMMPEDPTAAGGKPGEPLLFRPGEEFVWRALFEISQQASRKRRASNVKHLLEGDLEVIEKLADAARAEMKKRAQDAADEDGAAALVARAKMAASAGYTWNWADFRDVDSMAGALTAYRGVFARIVEHDEAAEGKDIDIQGDLWFKIVKEAEGGLGPEGARRAREGRGK